MHELMDRYKTPDASRRLATIILASGALGRPMLATPGIPPERVKMLRDAFNATMKDPAFLDEIKRRKFELEPARGEELETIVKEAMSQPPEIIEKMKKLLGEGQ
jgi:tripartite-type tricarboxylate transporter receptor subunit TctC